MAALKIFPEVAASDQHELGAQSSMHTRTDFATTRAEVLAQAGIATKVTDDDVTFSERFRFFLENLLSSNPNALFYILFVVSACSVLVSGPLWVHFAEDGNNSYGHGVWMSFQVFASQGGLDGEDIEEVGHRVVFSALLFFGLVVFAILVGMITEAFQEMMSNMTAGKSKVAMEGHTVILGWNEATIRTVCQIAFLRRQWQQQNRSCMRRWLRIGRAKPSTVVAKGRVVVLCNTKTKAEMEEELQAAFAHRGVSPKRTCVGWDIICRVGDPTNLQHLVSVGVHRATAIMVQMTESDYSEMDNHDGAIDNGMTLRTMLALRHVLFTSKRQPRWEDLRIVVQLASPSEVIDAATFAAPDGRRLVFLEDLSLFLNSLLFTCTAYAGLAALLMDLLGFEGNALRARRADSFPDKGASIIGKTISEAAYAWEDGIVIGAIARNGLEISRRVIDPDNGIAPNSVRRIASDDRIIFVSETSSPKPMRDYDLQARLRNTVVDVPNSVDRDRAEDVSVLICGWRREWDDPAQFHYQLRDTLSRYPRGSHMTFLCLKTEGEFEALIEDGAKSDGIVEKRPARRGWVVLQSTTVWHRRGDPAKTAHLQPVLLERLYSSAIILSTMSGGNTYVSPYSRDTRVMSVLVLLRCIQNKFKQVPMRVVGENALDHTAHLALVPQASDGSQGYREPDFVNVQAIQARALCQCLAYPRIEPAVAQLISGQPGTPMVVLRDALIYVDPLSSVTFFGLQAKVKLVHKDDICIGWRKNSERIVLVPYFLEEFTAMPGDTIAIVSRFEGSAEGMRALA